MGDGEPQETLEIRWWFPTAIRPPGSLSDQPGWSVERRTDRYLIDPEGEDTVGIKLRADERPERKELVDVLEAERLPIERWRKTTPAGWEPTGRQLVVEKVRWIAGDPDGASVEIARVRARRRVRWTLAAEVVVGAGVPADPLEVLRTLDRWVPEWRDWAPYGRLSSYPRFLTRTAAWSLRRSRRGGMSWPSPG